tara:strand:- start:316 stop:1011 length:696 start_codon:yes stop_codon:yes gene_type:complete
MNRTILALTILIRFSFSNISEAQSFGKFKNPFDAITGEKEETDEAPTLSVDQAQAELILALQSALGDVLAAQALIEEAKGNKDVAAKLNNVSQEMLGGDATTDDIKGAVTLTSDMTKAHGETFEESKEMTDDAKSLYAKALVPYLSSVAKTKALAGAISNFMQASQNELKSIRNPMQIRKLKGTLETGLFIGKTVPKLIVNLVKSSVGLLSFARKNGLDTSKADDIELELD